MLAREASTLLKKIGRTLSAKMGRPYSSIMGYVRTKVSFAILKATQQCIQGSRTPATRISSSFSTLEDGAGIALAY